MDVPVIVALDKERVTRRSSVLRVVSTAKKDEVLGSTYGFSVVFRT